MKNPLVEHNQLALVRYCPTEQITLYAPGLVKSLVVSADQVERYPGHTLPVAKRKWVGDAPPSLVASRRTKRQSSAASVRVPYESWQ